MNKKFYFFKNRTFLKCLIVSLAILLVGVLFHSYTNQTLIKLKKKDNSAEIKRLTDIADILYESNKMDSSYFYYNRVKKICDPKINTIDYVYALSSIAELQYNQGNFIDSQENATQALPYLKFIKNPRYSWIVYNLLGLDYLSTYDNNNAILYFKKALALKSSTWRKYIAMNNLAAVYMNQKKYNEASKLFLLLSKQKNISKYQDTNENIYSFLIDNLGFCYYKMGNHKKALDCFYKSLKIRIKPKTQEGLINSYKHLAIYFKKNNRKLALYYAEKADKHAIRTKSATDRITTLTLLIELSESNKTQKYLNTYIPLVDSITISRQTTKNQFSNIKYTCEKEKTENLQLKAQKVENELELERQKNRTLLSYIIITFIIGFITFLYFYLKSKGRREKKQAIFESEIRISKKLNYELTHDVFQTLNFAKNVDLDKDENKEKLLDDLDTLYSKTRNISKENSVIITDENYNLALKEMISQFKTSDLNIILHGFDLITWNEIEKNKKIILYRVLQELFANMEKHSFATLVSITFKTIDKKLNIVYNDNGAGTRNKRLILKNGLQNVESRIKTINGNIIFDYNSEKGFRLNFSFPI